jgi:hypothetical protein
MASKLLNSLRLLSIGILFIAYMLSYASLPERVLIDVDSQGNAELFLTKNTAFYAGMVLIVIVNLVLFLLIRLLKQKATNLSLVLIPWLSGLVILINLFFAFAASFLGVLNSQENFDYSNFGNIVYLIGGVFIIWLIGLLYSVLKVRLIN